MKENALGVYGLTKRYPDFLLNEVSFTVPRGTIVGLIGENGAGKSTTIKAILALINKDAGQIEILGRKEREIDFDTRNRIGVVFDKHNFPVSISPNNLGKLLENVYPLWDRDQYGELLKKLSIPAERKIKKLSKGMKMKLAIAVALSHHSEILILDEATSGLDPIVRDDILDMLLEFVQDERHSILVSSHITSDLEKVADYIVFLHEGKVIFNKAKDELRYGYGIMKCGAAQFEKVDRADVVAYRKQDFEWQILIENRNEAQRKYPDSIIDPATLDDIMLLFVKGALK